MAGSFAVVSARVSGGEFISLRPDATFAESQELGIRSRETKCVGAFMGQWSSWEDDDRSSPNKKTLAPGPR